MNAESHMHFTSGPLVLEEVMKIVSLLENPPEAEYIRKALALYTIPDRYRDAKDFKWGTNNELMAALLHYENPQNPFEFDKMLKILEGKTSLLEIGSNFGGSLKRMAAVMPRGSKIVSVDLDLDKTPKFLNPIDTLKENCRKIGMLGANVELFIGDSHSKQTIEAVRRHGPFEFVFIDGDHTYDGVKADWENYGPMGKIVAFHDIATVPEVNKFWNEMRVSTPYRFEEYVDTEKFSFGIGVIFRE